MKVSGHVVALVVAALFVGGICSSGLAQAPVGLQFSDLGKRHLTVRIEQSRDACFCDVDGDGDLDLLVGNEGQNRLHRNDGHGVFTEVTAQQLPVDNNATTSIACGDLDGDGDPDLLIGNATQPIRLLRNDGTGTFADVTGAQFPNSSTMIAVVILGDIDGDGDLDAFCGNWLGQQDRLFANDGSGVFTEVSATQLPQGLTDTHAATFADVDGDGDLDIATGNQLLQNDGSGSFVDVGPQSLPLPWTTVRSVACEDVDGDGDGDLILGTQYQNRLLLNDGTGVFTNVSATHMPLLANFTLSLAVGDVDGDGDPDIVCGNILDDQDTVYLNDGTGVFVDATASQMPVSTDYTDGVALADVDGNGSLDLVLARRAILNGRQNALLLNDGSGSFAFANAERFAGAARMDHTTAIAAGDVDGDGDLDIVYGNRPTIEDPSGQNRLYLGDGAGGFIDATSLQLPANVDQTEAIALGDVDGDSDLDLICGNLGQANRLYLNDGAGNFSTSMAAQLPPINNACRALALGDVDGDGDLDVVCGTGTAFGQQQNNLFLNDGTGSYADVSAIRLPAGSDHTMGIALADVDGDGDLDIVCACWAQQNRLFLNDGSGFFSDATALRMPATALPTRCVSVGDVDGDGDVDLVFGNDPQADSLYRNDGTGTFTDVSAAQMPAAAHATRSIRFGDADGDADLDLIAVTDGANVLLVNDGNGVFATSTAARMPDDANDSWSLVLADVGRDGDLDALVGNHGPNKLHHNLQRQLDAPHVLRPGQPYRLHCYARGAAAMPSPVAFVFVSTTRVVVPLPPLGVLGIQPVLGLPAAAIPQPGGVHVATWMVPNVSGISGVAIYAQALFATNELRLTNVTQDVMQ